MDHDRGSNIQPSNDPLLRASDDDRHRVAELLGEHASAGRLTIAELEERVGRAYAATTRGELAELTRDLPTAPDPTGTPAPNRGRGRVSRWLLAIFGGSHRRGQWRMSTRINAVSIFGGDDIDLRDVEVDGSELVITSFALFGGPDIYLPDTMEVEITGLAIFGGNDERGSGRRAGPHAPVVRIRSFALFGGADIWRLPAEAQALSLKEAKRAAKAIGR